MKSVPARHEIAPADTWNKPSVYRTDADWEAAVADLTTRLQTAQTFQNQLGRDASTLAAWMTYYESTVALFGQVMTYAFMAYAVDVTDTSTAATYDRARGISAQVQGELAFAEPELAALTPEHIAACMEAEPSLRQYAHYFAHLTRQRPHLRSGEVEAVLAMASDPLGTGMEAHTLLTDSDMRFPPAHDHAGKEYPVEQGNIDELLQSTDATLRRTAWEGFAQTHLVFQNTMATCLAGGIRTNVLRARVHHFDDALSAALYEHALPTAVFHNLLATFRRNLPIWHRYWAVRRAALKCETLHEYDVYAPLGRAYPSVAFDTGAEWICAAMEPLGPDYVAALRRGIFTDRWVDRYPNKGKSSGAFSDGRPGTHPFILMSFSDDLHSVSTLAHELGHSMHSYLSWKTQPIVLSGYSMFVAETASNFNQVMLRAHLLKTNSDPAFQLAVLEEEMYYFHRYLFIMPTLARFEYEIHQRAEHGQALNAPALNALLADLFREAYGPAVTVDTDMTGIIWALFKHLYGNYYVFQYTTGISAAYALGQRVQAGVPGAAEAYIEFLKAGGSCYPLDALKRAGVDLSTPAPVEAAFAMLNERIERLAHLLQLDV